MWKATLYGPQDLRIEEAPLDTSRLKPNEIWVQTEITAFKIGTDRGNYEGAEMVPSAPSYPRWVGDSNLGIVRARGENVSRFAPGDRVFARKPHQSDYIAHENEEVIKIPSKVSPEDAVFLGLYHVSAISYWRCHYQPGETVAVVGLGVLGMAAVALGCSFGARVIAIGNSSTRLAMAAKMGAHMAVLSEDPDLHRKIEAFAGPIGVDLVILTANPWPAYRVAAEVVRTNGRIGILSLPGRGEAPLDFNPLAMRWLYAKSLTLTAVTVPAPSLYPTPVNRFSLENIAPALLNLMATGSVEPKRLITHRLPSSRLAEAYEMALAREKGILGVVFDWH